ncbi:MAG: Asp-tRNA(Asn)/Glu-tRNA(Gln) amidotransferase subunit GatC, partial [Candidatus Aenigmatarchaeota archaeon]
MIEIEKIAWLARIKLEEKEKEELFKDISKILEMFKKIQEVKIEEKDIDSDEIFDFSFREETIAETFDNEKILKNFPKRDENLLE